MMKTSDAGMLSASIAINSYLIRGVSFAGAAEGFNGEYITFFHALVRSCLDKGDLFVAVDLVAQDVMPGEAPKSFDRDRLALELDFVALHYFLDCLADVVDPGVDAGFLSIRLASQTP
jgi:hypothetical protein